MALYAAFNEHDESRYIADRLGSWIADGNRRDDAAVLYRSNAQSRVLEAALLQADIPTVSMVASVFMSVSKLKMPFVISA